MLCIVITDSDVSKYASHVILLTESHRRARERSEMRGWEMRVAADTGPATRMAGNSGRKGEEQDWETQWHSSSLLQGGALLSCCWLSPGRDHIKGISNQLLCVDPPVWLGWVTEPAARGTGSSSSRTRARCTGWCLTEAQPPGEGNSMWPQQLTTNNWLPRDLQDQLAVSVGLNRSVVKPKNTKYAHLDCSGFRISCWKPRGTAWSRSAPVCPATLPGQSNVNHKVQIERFGKCFNVFSELLTWLFIMLIYI